VLADRPDWELVLSSSHQATPDQLGSLPERAHVFSWIPQVRVLQHADALVTHGGINTLDESVLNGVPMLVYCGGETDMAGNTARVVHHGIGIAGDRHRDRSADIGNHLDRLMNEPGFAGNISRLRRHYEAYRENRVAERVVQSLLRDGSTADETSDASGTGS
jgi:UDP:flavonoid glycosyltransferase YjiC (YdhE family)